MDQVTQQNAALVEEAAAAATALNVQAGGLVEAVYVFNLDATPSKPAHARQRPPRPSGRTPHFFPVPRADRRIANSTLTHPSELILFN